MLTRIAEETHYYPHGLKIAALSARAFNKLDNKYGYQGHYAENDEQSGFEEFALRMYDAQLGRWTAADPYLQFPSPYVGMGNDPVNNLDPDGGYIFNWTGAQFFGTLSGMIAGSLVGYNIAKTNGGNPMTGAMIGMLSGGGAGLGLGSMNWEAVGSFFGNFPDPLSLTNLLNNPDFVPLSTADLRSMIRAFDNTLESWQVNISAGILLEDAYQQFTKFQKNTRLSLQLVSGSPYIRLVIPDFHHFTEVTDGRNSLTFPTGGVIEVKAIESNVSLNTGVNL